MKHYGSKNNEKISKVGKVVNHVLFIFLWFSTKNYEELAIRKFE